MDFTRAISIKELRDYIADVYANLSISYAVIDEVHCSQNGGMTFERLIST
ncbi:MAG: hypothetical protein R2879_18260 [Saprospiraceae bacterium]